MTIATTAKSSFAQPYLKLGRYDRPIGAWLLMWPCWWSLTLASNGFPDPYLLILFTLGAIVMRGAGCTINDIVDRNLDPHVERTKNRPLAARALSLPQAILFLGLQCSVGLAILLQLNTNAIILGAVSLVPVVLYPFMKRWTHWPQAFLGLTFNWGALLGWCAVTGTLSLSALALYVGGVLWTLGYDTIYGHQDKTDDVLIGIKSTALTLANNTKIWLSLFYGGMVGFLALAGALEQLPYVYYILLLMVAGHLVWQILTLDSDNPEDCLRKFKSNHLLGFLVFLCLLGSVS